MLATLFEVIMIDLVLAADNAIVIGLAAAGLPVAERRKAILIGIAAATVLRIVFALMTTQLLGIEGLVLAGGLMLLWVCWKMGREIASGEGHDPATVHEPGTFEAQHPHHHKTIGQAAVQIVIADVSMSLDNVLAVAGASREEPLALIFGLTLSIAMMAFAASMIARVLGRFRWIAWGGLAVIFYVAIGMIADGARELGPHAMAVFEWLQATPVAIAIRESALLLGGLSGLHLVGFTLLTGAVLVSSLRLAGLFLTGHDAVTVTRPAARAVAAGLVISVVTGVLLFAPRAADASLNRTFRLKMQLLVVAAAFQFTIHRLVRKNPDASRVQQQLVGLTAFLLWTAVGVAGCVFILLE